MRFLTDFLPRSMAHSLPPKREITVFLKFIYRKLRGQNLLDDDYININTFYDGVDTAINYFWIPACYCLLSLDFYHYFFNPLNRYQITLLGLFVGKSENYQYMSLSSNLGGDIPSFSFLDYWYWTSIPIFAVMTGLWFYYQSGKIFDIPMLYRSEINDRSFIKKVRQDFFGYFPYLSRNFWELYRFKYRLSQKNYRATNAPNEYYSINAEPRFDFDTREQLNKIVICAQDRSYWAKWQGIVALADIIYFRGQIPQDLIARNALIGLRVVQKPFGTDSLSTLFAYYQEWRSGKSKIFWDIAWGIC